MRILRIGNVNVAERTITLLDENDQPIVVYGSTVTVNEDGSVDLVNESATVTLDGSGNWRLHANIASWFYDDNRLPGMETSVTNEFGCSNMYKHVTYSNAGNLKNGKFTYGGATGNNRLAIKDTRFTTVSDFTTFLNQNNLQICYKLAEPITYHLDTSDDLTTLIGDNNIWLDCGDISALKYYTQNTQYGMKWKEDRALELRRRAIIASSPTLHDAQSETGLVSFNADMVAPMKLAAQIEPVQDLNGYDHPWPAGGGKNLYKDTFDGWTKPVNYWIYPISLPEGRYKLSVSLRAGKTAVTGAAVGFAKSGTQYTDFDGLVIALNTGGGTVAASPVTITSNDAPVLAFYGTEELFYAVMDAYEVQLELGSTATSYAPYSNVCPISGWTGCNVWDDPKYGGTIRWNQKISKGDFPNIIGWNGPNSTKSASNNIMTCTLTAVSSATQINRDAILAVVGHKYLASCEVNPSKATKARWQYSSVATGISTITLTARKWQTVTNMFTQTGVSAFLLYYCVDTSLEVGDTVQFRNFNVFDLTEMFGAGSEPATVEEFRALFPNDYYEYTSTPVETCVSAVNNDPYETIPVSWQSSAGTVYGGTLDVTSGVLTVDRIFAAFLAIGKQNNFMYTTLTQQQLPSIKGLNAGAICNRYHFVSNVAGADTSANITIYANGIIRWIEPDYIDKTYQEFNAMMGDNRVEVVYELATPITYHLDAIEQITTLLGTNNIWTDTGGIDVKYWSHGSQNNT